jgi:putative sterol carrier protein
VTEQTAQTPEVDRESLAGIVETLKAMTAVGARDRLWLRRKKDITIQYEFVDGDAVHAFHSAVHGTDWTFGEGAQPDEDCDVILRTTPKVLSEVLTGVTGGREAMLSGALSMRKAPSHPKLLLMRAIFNRYTKAQERGELVDLNGEND